MQYLICQSIWHCDAFSKVHEVLWTSVHIAWQHIDQGARKHSLLSWAPGQLQLGCSAPPSLKDSLTFSIPHIPSAFVACSSEGLCDLLADTNILQRSDGLPGCCSGLDGMNWPEGTTKCEPSFLPLLSSQAYIKPVKAGISNSLGLYAK